MAKMTTSIHCFNVLVLAVLQFPVGAELPPWTASGLDSALGQIPWPTDQASTESSGDQSGSSGLEAQWTPVSSVEGQDDLIEKEFLEEVEAALGSKLLDSSREHMEDITKALRFSFEALEKNEYGKLGHTAVKYALHRLFLSRHGWLIKGLDPAGQNFNSSSPVQVLEGKASLHVQGVFEKRLAGQGFGLQELAVFGSVLETLISLEAGERLRVMYEKLGMPLDKHLTEQQLTTAVELYMTAYILGLEMEELTSELIWRLRKMMPEVYESWREAKMLSKAVREEVLEDKDYYTIEDVTTVVVKIGERFAKWQEAECQQAKNRLVSLEAGEEGCVPLQSFYKGRNGWKFTENIEYLKQNGVIDESDPQNMQVMIANYVTTAAMCISSSAYYSVCCTNECEALLEHIESHVRGSTATADDLISLVEALQSSTVAANRTLPLAQAHRLRKIAEVHDGRVPIYGRLFMQWMHMVYPRECAYPHLTGTTKPATVDEWMRNNKSTEASDKEMQTLVNAPTHRSDQQGQCGRWVDGEELYMGAPTPRRSLRELETDMETWWVSLSVFLLCLAATSMIAVIQTFKSMKHMLCGSQKLILV